MSTDIMPEPSPSTSICLERASSKAAKPSQPLVALSPPDDPALIIGLALALARQGASDARAIPSVLLDRLHHLARSGEPTCRLVHDFLNRRAGANDRTDAGQGVPTEIVSVLSAVQEEC